jgi:tetratricopeptide (TPR) repeat protein
MKALALPLECDPDDFSLVAPARIVDDCTAALSHKERLTNHVVLALYRRRADAFFQLQQFSRAKLDYDEALKLDPKYPETRLRRAEVVGCESLAASIAEIQAILKDEPRFARAYADLGTIALQQGDATKSVELETKALSIEAQLSQPYGVRSEAYLRLGKLEEALHDVDTYIQIHPFAAFTEVPEAPQ